MTKQNSGFEWGGDGNPYQSNPIRAEQQLATKKHSGLGIASFVCALIAGVACVGVLTVALMVTIEDPSGLDDEMNPMFVVVGLTIMVAGALDLLSMVLGVGCLFQSERKRLFGVLGLVLSTMTVLGLLGLIVLGS